MVGTMQAKTYDNVFHIFNIWYVRPKQKTYLDLFVELLFECISLLLEKVFSDTISQLQQLIPLLSEAIYLLGL